jgi:hypothetical protein
MNRESITHRIYRHVSPAARSVAAALLLVAGMRTAAVAEVSLEMTLDKDRAYPGEAVPLTVTLRVSDATVRNIGYPRLATPAGGKVEFLSPVQMPDPRDPDATLYRFAGQISNDKPGTLTVGPAQLDCETMQTAGGSAAFFGEVEPRPLSLVTTPTALTILPLPAAGRPVSFSGAVGIFNISVSTRPELVVVGEPLSIITTIQGTGNMGNATCPDATGENMNSYPVRSSRTAAALVCEQVLVPSAAGGLPPIVWSYFDPQKSRYHTLHQALPEVVAPPAAAPVFDAVPQPTLAPPASHRSRMPFWLAAAIVLSGAFAVGSTVWWRRNHANPDGPPADDSSLEQHLAMAEQALADGCVEIFYTLIFVIIQQVVGSLCKIPAAGVSGIPASLPTLNPCEKKIRRLFSRCDEVRYGCREMSGNDMKDDLTLLRALLQDIPLSVVGKISDTPR